MYRGTYFSFTGIIASVPKRAPLFFIKRKIKASYKLWQTPYFEAVLLMEHAGSVRVISLSAAIHLKNITEIATRRKTHRRRTDSYFSPSLKLGTTH